jgi:hypothetical protein
MPGLSAKESFTHCESKVGLVTSCPPRGTLNQANRDTANRRTSSYSNRTVPSQLISHFRGRLQPHPARRG